MKKIQFFLLFLLSGFFLKIAAQQTFPVNGVHDERHLYYAFINARITVDYKTVIEKGTLIVKDGVVEIATANASIPKGAVIFDLKGKSIYPSLVDMYSDYGVSDSRRPSASSYPQINSAIKGAYNWNQAVKPEFSASAAFNADPKKAEELRKLGFGAVNAFSKDGIARGTSVLVTLADEKENKVVIRDRGANMLSFEKGSSTQEYPSSLMGSIALIRQTYLDAQWYKSSKKPKEYNISLDFWNRNQDLPQIFEVSDKYTALRADKVGDEFGIQYILKGAGDEYQRIREIKATNATFILPLNFPLAFDMEDPYDAMQVSLGDMKHWELAPGNPAALEKAGISFALTTSDLKDKKDFWKNIRKAMEYGLSEEQALKALTQTPAELLKATDKVGALRPGMLANFIITSKKLFDKDNIIYENWVQGTQYIVNEIELNDLRGKYSLKIGSMNPMALLLDGEAAGDIKASIGDSSKAKVKFAQTGNLVTIQIEPDKEPKGQIRLSGYIDKEMLRGNGQLSSGEWIKWTASLQSKTDKPEKKDTTKKSALALGALLFPNKEYGWKELPRKSDVLFKNVTVWTNESEGILKNASVLVKDGKIAGVYKEGESVSSGSAEVIDGKGMHLTAGIIDEHSHIAISRGVNEGTQAVTSEVRIGDVVDGDDIDIYRQLSGGVVASQLLHGSANPIGGQSAIIKLRWGLAPEQMKLEGADGFIKFALGENVKQSNWGERYVVRFPQTRMGVEQVYMDAFTRAKEYEQAMKAASAENPVRRDLELDALVEILNRKRFITCHSYVQSEINMLMHVADSMGFKVNTFTHILEGYKVADKMKAHGVMGASTFADWWAYKHEVIEAIPYNAALMTKMGLNVSVNSDDAEMGRRLNQEAAKTVKYGGLTEEEAFKLCTLNPARMLHIDHRTGSIKAGKDADLVLWTDNPLSIYARVDRTFVDGICYFDARRDVQLREEIRKERARLIQKMADARKAGEGTQKALKNSREAFHCEQ